MALAAVLAAAPGMHVARADVYTWTDASGRLNVSNIAPPDGVRVTRVVHEDPAKARASAAARAAARDADVRALTERVAELADEVERARSRPPPAPYRVAVAPPPAPVVVNVLPPAPPVQYEPPPATYAANCDPTVFGCPVFGYPANIVVLNTQRFHRFHRFDPVRGGHRFPVTRPLHPAAALRGR